MLQQAKTATKSLARHGWLAGLLILMAAALTAQPALAQGNPDDSDPPGAQDSPAAARTIVWFLDDSAIVGDQPRATARKAPAILQKIVEQSPDKHIVALDPDQLSDHMARLSRPTPDCLQGLAPCKAPLGVIIEGLGADLLLRAKLGNAGAGWSMDVEMIGPTGSVVLKRSFKVGGVDDQGQPRTLEAGLEQLAFDAVRELFQATGALEIVTRPAGAQVDINGRPAGESPLIVELPVGTHELQISLDNHLPSKHSAKVAAGKRTKLELDLSAQMATLTVDSTPVLGEVFIDNRSVGTAGTPLSLPPGEYELEIRAEGFKSRTQRIIVSPDENKIVSLTLEQRRPQLHVASLGEVDTEAILARNFFLRASYRFTSFSTGLADAQGQLDNQVFSTGDLVSADEEGRRDFAYHGLHFDAGYHWEHFGLVGLGLSIFSSGDRAEGALKTSDTQLEGVQFDDFTRLELKPAQLIFRYPYKNLFPAVQTGLGYFNTSFVADAGDNGTIDLERDGFFWHFSIEVSYFFDTWWYGYANLGIQRDLSHDDSSTQTLLGFGVGVTFENPLKSFGIGETEPPKEY